MLVMVNPGLEVTEMSELQSQLQLLQSSSALLIPLGELTVTRLFVEGAKVLLVEVLPEVVLELVVVLVLVEVVLVSVVTSKTKEKCLKIIGKCINELQLARCRLSQKNHNKA